MGPGILAPRRAGVILAIGLFVVLPPEQWPTASRAQAAVRPRTFPLDTTAGLSAGRRHQSVEHCGRAP
jgi:hypothetical protein